MHKIFIISLWVAIFSILNGCTQPIQDGPPPFHVDVSRIPNAVPKDEPKSKYANPSTYVVNGRRYYVLTSAKGYNQRGIASWYGWKFNKRLTSNREPYNMLAMTGASRVLPIPSYVRVTNLENGHSIIVRINDRGPFAPNRIIDLSYVAAKKLGYVNKGTALVQVTAIDVHHPNVIPTVKITHQPKLFLQIGAFTSRINAEHLKEKVHYYTMQPIRIIKITHYNESIYRVQIGPLVGVKESDLLQTRLEKVGVGHAITVIG